MGKWLIGIILGSVLISGGVWAIAPSEQVNVDFSFDPKVLGDDIDAYLAASEAQFSDITPGTEKRIVWAGAAGTKTAVSVIYLHGFSATSEEIRPVPDRVARALGANLFFARLSGHGRGGDAMAEPVADDWIRDTAEALAIGRAIGDQVIVLSTSTGGTLAAIAATDPAAMERVKGITFVSPNFGIASPASTILTWPLVRRWGPVVAGAERSFEPVNALHAKYWTTRYPTAALFPMAALVKHALGLDFARASVPALFLYSNEDRVASPAATAQVATQWGGPVTVQTVTPGADDDPYSHVIAGDILSPDQTDAAIATILDWVRGI
ncbi:alpha/beta hydrolase [Pseudogemmobacter sp. W21_MBD1_M6]|uniref:alpha/beta hydrolase n=1 Tax=Pseudogemmobacter sp. W21_MBD1_M6 TaxID=3240271 RepID=UPI003F9C9D1B